MNVIPKDLQGWVDLENLEELQKKANKQQLAAKRDQCRTTAAVFSTPAGKAWLDQKIREHIMKPVAVPGRDRVEIGIHQGQYNVIASILAEIEFARTGGKPEESGT